jgi:LmbE family N-acetylglucosaminyl deacetylase
VLAVSPHLDDAVISAGACLAGLEAEGWPITVLTVFAGDPGRILSPVAQRHHDRCGLGPDAVARRRAEDRAALGRIGARPCHGLIPDVVYRPRPDGGWACDEDADMFAIPPMDPLLDDAVRDLIGQAISKSGCGLLLGPSAAGSHVDHVLTDRAVSSAAAQHGLPLWRWKDEPYASADGGGTATDGSVVVPYSPVTLALKLDAISCYTSQVPMLWPGGTRWRTAVSITGPPGRRGELFTAHDETSAAMRTISSHMRSRP